MAGYADVYDLEVESSHEFFAAGILVHNCRYGLKSYLAPRGKPFEIRVAEKVDTIAKEQGHESFADMEPTSRAMLARRVNRYEKRNGGIRMYRPFGKRWRN